MRTGTNRHSAATLSLCAGLGVLFSIASPAFATATVEKSYVLKLRINIFKMSEVDKARAKEYVKGANAILKQAMIRLDLVDACIKENVDGVDANGALNWTRPDGGDYVRAEKAGKKEVGEGKGKGLKLGFAKSVVIDGVVANGASNLCVPVAFARKNPLGDAKGGETTAHELLHSLGIDHVASMDNIMFGTSGRTDTKMTADQIMKVKMKAKDVGEETSKKKGASGAAPASKTPSEHGAKAGSDTPPLRGVAEYLSVDFARVSSVGSDDEYRLMLDLGGLIPDAPSSSTTDYLFLFDADNNDATGSALHGRMGIDRAVRAHVGDASNITFSIENGDGSGSTPITGSRFRSEIDAETEGPPGIGFPSSDLLSMSVPRSMLTLSGGDLLDVGVITEDSSLGVTDDFDLTLDRIIHTRGPSLLTDEGTYEPGETMTLQGFGFQPFEPLEILLDDTLLGMVSADAFGAFNAFFNAPMGLDSTFYFLSAHPADLIALAGAPSMESGTTVVNIPAPATVMLSIAGIVLAAGRRRPR